MGTLATVHHGLTVQYCRDERLSFHSQTKMADGGGSPKRIKTNDENDKVRRRNGLVAPEAENERLRAENALLRRETRIGDVLPAVVPTPTVDISRLDASLAIHIASFVGTSLELLNLALTCKAFGWQRPGSGSGAWSFVEEVARQVVCSGKNDIEGVRITLPEYVRGKTTWLSILYDSEHPLKLDTLIGRHIGHLDGRKSSVQLSSVHNKIGSAIASGYVMESGSHYAEFQTMEDDDYHNLYFGIVRPMLTLDLGSFSEENRAHMFNDDYRGHFLAQRTDEWGSGGIHACDYCTSDGLVSWTDWDSDAVQDQDWEGSGICEPGETVGMLLNLDEGTLAVYINNRRLGVLKHGLSGVFCWCTTLMGNSVVTIKKSEPPTVT